MISGQCGDPIGGVNKLKHFLVNYLATFLIMFLANKSLYLLLGLEKLI
jgi:hypothetical protein